MDIQRFQDLLFNSSDPDPSYDLDERELSFGRMILDIAIQVRKKKLMAATKAGLKMTHLEYSNWREEARQKAENDQIEFRNLLALPEEGIEGFKATRPDPSNIPQFYMSYFYDLFPPQGPSEDPEAPALHDWEVGGDPGASSSWESQPAITAGSGGNRAGVTAALPLTTTRTGTQSEAQARAHSSVGNPSQKAHTPESLPQAGTTHPPGGPGQGPIPPGGNSSSTVPPGGPTRGTWRPRDTTPSP